MAKRIGINESETGKSVGRLKDIIYQSTIEPKNYEEEKEELVRKTFFLSEELFEALSIYSFREKKQKSVAIRELLTSAIPVDILNEAKETLKKGKRVL